MKKNYIYLFSKNFNLHFFSFVFNLILNYDLKLLNLKGNKNGKK